MSVKQPLKKHNNKSQLEKKKISNHHQKFHKPKYGTSKLEIDFAHDFLDKIGIKYIYEYEAKDIHRFYDFAIVQYQDIPWITEIKHGVNSVKQDEQNPPISFFIEIDGGYW